MSAKFNCKIKIEVPYTIQEFKERKLTGSYFKLEKNTLTSGSFSNGSETGVWSQENIEGALKKWRYESQRVGALCRDGTRSGATGRGACSWHGGVERWLYGSFRKDIVEQELSLEEQLQNKQEQICELLGLLREQYEEQELLCQIFKKSILFIKAFLIIKSKYQDQSKLFEINKTVGREENIKLEKSKQLEQKYKQLLKQFQIISQQKLRIQKKLEEVVKETARKQQFFQEVEQQKNQLQTTIKNIQALLKNPSKTNRKTLVSIGYQTEKRLTQPQVGCGNDEKKRLSQYYISSQKTAKINRYYQDNKQKNQDIFLNQDFSYSRTQADQKSNFTQNTSYSYLWQNSLI